MLQVYIRPDSHNKPRVRIDLRFNDFKRKNKFGKVYPARGILHISAPVDNRSSWIIDRVQFTGLNIEEIKPEEWPELLMFIEIKYGADIQQKLAAKRK